jgi:threonine/homoserine/homoserine lactone efflux protein
MSLIITICTFALAMSISPGPVNIITLSSGANHGFWRTLPFVSGATFGFTVLLFLLGIGLMELVELYPNAIKMMEYLGTAFILYMAVKVFSAQATLHVEDVEDVRIPNFREGIMLQWLNPKAWVACLSGISTFTTKGDLSSLMLFCILYFIICYGSISFWATLGAKTKYLLRTENQQNAFNKFMGTALALVALYLLFT